MDNSKQLARIVMREKVPDKEKAKVLGWIRPPRGGGPGSKHADSGETAFSGTSSFWRTIQRYAIGSQMQQASGDTGGKQLAIEWVLDQHDRAVSAPAVLNLLALLVQKYKY